MAKYTQLDATAIAALTGRISKSANTLRNLIQQAAVQVTGHAIATGDVRPATALVEACGKQVRRQALVAFLEKHGPFAWSTQDKGFKFFKREGLTFNGEELMAVAWEGATPDKIESTIDVAADVEKLLKRINARIADHGGKVGEANIANLELRDGLVKLINEFRAEVYEEEEAPLPELKAA